jgi:hypothetical protein
MAAEVKARIDRYLPLIGLDDNKLIPCLHAFINFLPPAGRASIATDILNCGNDDKKLFQVFENLSTALLYPSKFYYVDCYTI